MLCRANKFGTGYSTTGRHYITINGKMIMEAISQGIDSPILKTKGKLTLPPMSISVVGIKTPTLCNTNNLYELNISTFQLPEGIIPLGVLHRVNHKTPQSLNIPILNASSGSCSITRNSPIATLEQTRKFEEIQEVSWYQVQGDTMTLLPEIPKGTKLQLEPDTKSPMRSIADVDRLDEAKVRLQELLDRKYVNIISQTATDIGRTNLIELDIPTEGPPIASKPYTVPLKYPESVDCKIKQLEEVGIISQSMSDLASPILVASKKEEHVDTSSNNASGGSKTVSSICDCVSPTENTNNWIQTACQIKAYESLGKVISNYPVHTIDSILA